MEGVFIGSIIGWVFVGLFVCPRVAGVVGGVMILAGGGFVGIGMGFSVPVPAAAFAIANILQIVGWILLVSGGAWLVAGFTRWIVDWLLHISGGSGDSSRAK